MCSETSLALWGKVISFSAQSEQQYRLGKNEGLAFLPRMQSSNGKTQRSSHRSCAPIDDQLLRKYKPCRVGDVPVTLAENPILPQQHARGCPSEDVEAPRES
eukprot:scaffold164681_cov34-Prasinocladus_malaysianus.AAC.2